MSQNSINIPLFWDPITNVINMHEIRSYAKRVVGVRNGLPQKEEEAQQ